MIYVDHLQVEQAKKEASGEFISKFNKDALYMALGEVPDRSGRIRGKGGVRLGLKKAYGAEYSMA